MPTPPALRGWWTSGETSLVSDQLALGKLTARSALLLNRFVGLGGVPAAINKTPQKRLLPTREQPDAPVRDETSQRLRSRAERHLHPHTAPLLEAV